MERAGEWRVRPARPALFANMWADNTVAGCNKCSQETMMVRLLALGCAFVTLVAVVALAVVYYVVWKNAD